MITYCQYSIREIPDIESVIKRLPEQQYPGRVTVRTCNRLEIYWGDGEFDIPVVLHLFRLVCGLESVFTGDTAVKAQVKNAYIRASQKGFLSKNMHRMFQWALSVGKLVHSTTDLAVGAVSYPQAVINIMKRFNADLRGLTVTVVGINEITLKLLKWLTQSGVTNLYIVNRTLEKGENIAGNFGASACQLEQLPGIASLSDVLILCTSSPEYLLKKSDITDKKPLCIIDLSWPQNADPGVNEIANVQLFTLDYIEQSINQNLERRKESVKLAELIIEQELCRIMSWQNKQKIIRDQIPEQKMEVVL